MLQQWCKATAVLYINFLILYMSIPIFNFLFHYISEACIVFLQQYLDYILHLRSDLD